MMSIFGPSVRCAAVTMDSLPTGIVDETFRSVVILIRFVLSRKVCIYCVYSLLVSLALLSVLVVVSALRQRKTVTPAKQKK